MDQRLVSRRRALQALGGLTLAGAVAGCSRAVGDEEAAAPATPATPASPLPPHQLDAFADEVRSGGPPPDGIPPIDQPVYVPAAQADGFLDPDDIVFGHIDDDQPRAYPQLVLVWHEIVNETDARGPRSVTYCPLTGSTVGFRPPTGSGIEQLGTSGNLVNSNLLMYDRTHESTWPQILGQAIAGPQRGEQLEEFPLEWTTWQRWRDTYPDTEVLSFETGFVRRYGEDPYGSYNPETGYYAGGSPLFPVMASDDRFGGKDVFLGAKLGEARLAVRKERVLEEQVVTAELAGAPVVFLHDPRLATARAYLTDGELDLEPGPGPGEYIDRRSGRTLDSWGRGPGIALERVLAYDVMWFAWFAFFPDTEVIA